MVDPFSAFTTLHDFCKTVAELAKTIRKIYVIDKDVEYILRELDSVYVVFSYMERNADAWGNGIIDNLLQKFRSDLVLATDMGKEMQQKLKKPAPKSKASSSYTSNSAIEASAPIESKSLSSDLPAAIEGESASLGPCQVPVTKYMRSVLDALVIFLRKAQYHLFSLDELKKLVENLSKRLFWLFVALTMDALRLGKELPPMKDIGLPLFRYIAKGRDREKEKTKVRELRFEDGDFRREQILSADGFNIAVLSSHDIKLPQDQQKNVYYLLDRERTVDERRVKDVGQVRKESETCARMFQLDEEDDPDEFIGETGLLPCSTLVISSGGINEKRCMLFILPSNSLGMPITLRQALASPSDEFPPPSLAHRIQLASLLAHSISIVHTMGLVHRAFRPDNIILIKSANSTDFDYNIGRPYLVGFNGMRAETEQSGVTDFRTLDFFRRAYCHPDLFVSPRPDFSVLEDIYSFGIVLLEILTWKPIMQYELIYEGRERHWSFSKEFPQLKDTMSCGPHMWANVFKKEADNLRQEVSRKLGDIVMYCLERGNISQKDGTVGTLTADGEKIKTGNYSGQASAFLSKVTLSLKEAADALGKPLNVW